MPKTRTNHGGAGLLLALAATAFQGAAATAQRTPDEVLRQLQAGNQRFAAQKSVPQPLGEGVRRTLARGQSPAAIVVCCADSRVPPEHLFNAGLGELVVIRIAGHAIDAETLASIEEAVEQLGVPLGVVLGHDHCEAIAGALAQVQAVQQGRTEPASSQARQDLLEQLEPAVRKVMTRDLGGRALAAACEEEHAQLTVTDCLRRSPLLRRYTKVGRFRLVAARYHLDSGEVEWLPGRPLPVEEAPLAAARQSVAPMTVPPHVALRLLQAGNQRFLGDHPPTADLTARRREQLLHAEQPLAIVLCCSDSRVAPEHIFDAGLGELLVLRIAAQTLTDNVLASIEEATSRTGVSLLVVLGHSQCSSFAGAAQQPEQQQLSPHMRALLTRLEPSLARARALGHTGAELLDRAARDHTLRVASEVRARSALLRRLEQEGRFAVLSSFYQLATGDVAWLKDGPEAAAAMPPAAPAGEPAHHPARNPAPDHGQPHGKDHDHHGKPAPEQQAASPTAAGNNLALLFEAMGHEEPVAHTKRTAAHHEPAHPAAPGPKAHAAPAKPHSAAHAGESGHGGTKKPDGESQHGGDHHGGDHHGGDHHGGAEADPHHAAAPAQGKPASPWRDPIFLIGLGGVVSLILAAAIALWRR